MQKKSKETVGQQKPEQKQKLQQVQKQNKSQNQKIKDKNEQPSLQSQTVENRISEQTKESKIEQIQQPKISLIQDYATINLKQLLNIMDQIKNSENKTPLILDPDGGVFQFFKYKGQHIDVQAMHLSEQMNKQDRTQSIEKTRKTLYNGLKHGIFTGFYCGETAKNLGEFYQNSLFWQQDFLFNPQAVLQESFYKNQILTTEEDQDNFGNKDCFVAKNEFSMFILISANYQDYDKLFQELGLDSKHFCIVKIISQDEQNQQ